LITQYRKQQLTRIDPFAYIDAVQVGTFIVIHNYLQAAKASFDLVYLFSCVHLNASILIFVT